MAVEHTQSASALSLTPPEGSEQTLADGVYSLVLSNAPNCALSHQGIWKESRGGHGVARFCIVSLVCKLPLQVF